VKGEIFFVALNKGRAFVAYIKILEEIKKRNEAIEKK
jgi:hypothetical protein